MQDMMVFNLKEQNRINISFRINRGVIQIKNEGRKGGREEGRKELKRGEYPCFLVEIRKAKPSFWVQLPGCQ